VRGQEIDLAEGVGGGSFQIVKRLGKRDPEGEVARRAIPDVAGGAGLVVHQDDAAVGEPAGTRDLAGPGVGLGEGICGCRQGGEGEGSQRPYQKS
jgi:hypothetical protein